MLIQREEGREGAGGRERGETEVEGGWMEDGEGWGIEVVKA